MIKIYNPFTENHRLFIETLQSECPSIMQVDSIEEDDAVYIIMINHLFIIEYENIKKELFKIKNKILYITEPVELLMEKQYYRKLIQLWKPLKIFTYCSENCKKINSFIPIQYFYPINQYLHFVEFNERLFQDREKDKIVFIGKMNTYRNAYKQLLGDDLIIIEDKYTKEEWTRILYKYQYFLNIHRRPNSKCFETFRCLPLLLNGAVIISEEVNDIEFKYRNIYFSNKEDIQNDFQEIKKKSFQEIYNNYHQLQKIEYNTKDFISIIQNN